MKFEQEYNFKVGDEVITSTGEVGVIKDICDCKYCKERGFCEPQVETKIGNGTIYITDNDKRVNFRSFYKIGDYIFGNLDEDCLLYDIKRTEEEINRLKNELNVLKKQQNVMQRLEFQKDDSNPIGYESTQTVTKGSTERFCDIKTLEYTTYPKDTLTITDQEYISRAEAFNRLNTIRMQAEDSKERNTCTRMVAALLEVPVSDVKVTRNCEECDHFSKSSSQYPCSHCRNCYIDQFKARRDGNG